MRFEKELEKIKTLGEEERLEKLQEICTDDESLNDALEIAKHESTLHLPGAMLITAVVAISLNFVPDVILRIVLLITWGFTMWYLIKIGFRKWTDVYYDLIEIRRNKRNNYMRAEKLSRL